MPKNKKYLKNTQGKKIRAKEVNKTHHKLHVKMPKSMEAMHKKQNA